jgi:hypothetical protein
VQNILQVFLVLGILVNGNPTRAGCFKIPAMIEIGKLSGRQMLGLTYVLLLMDINNMSDLSRLVKYDSL